MKSCRKEDGGVLNLTGWGGKSPEADIALRICGRFSKTFGRYPRARAGYQKDLSSPVFFL